MNLSLKTTKPTTKRSAKIIKSISFKLLYFSARAIENNALSHTNILDTWVLLHFDEERVNFWLKAETLAQHAENRVEDIFERFLSHIHYHWLIVHERSIDSDPYIIWLRQSPPH